MSRGALSVNRILDRSTLCLLRAPYVAPFFVYEYFTPPLRFTRANRGDLEVENLFEVGMNFGSETGFDLPLVRGSDIAIGGAYVTGDDFSAFRLTIGFPF